MAPLQDQLIRMRHNYEPSRDEIGTIARLHKPRGWRIVQSRRVTGLADSETHCLYVPFLHSCRALYYLLHECGHVHLGHLGKRQDLADHLCEYEAEQYAIHTMRALRIEPGAKLVLEARIYVGQYIEADRKAGVKIDPTVQKWVGKIR